MRAEYLSTLDYNTILLLEIQYPFSAEDVCFYPKIDSVSLGIEPKPAEVAGNLTPASPSTLTD